jgi:hypothetical protein
VLVQFEGSNTLKALANVTKIKSSQNAEGVPLGRTLSGLNADLFYKSQGLSLTLQPWAEISQRLQRTSSRDSN